MIVAEHLTKRYGTTLAIDDVTFEVQKGEVVGFLGPNGAGKTTTMRILAGSLGATSGRALIDGLDVFESPLETRRRVGYLPEVPPLYPNMTVNGYVRFAARIKGAVDLDAAVDRVLGRVGLADMGGRLVGHLSKGFQQRVGLAQALVHDPEVLILDEPTSGLDPAQRKEIRDLVKDLAGERTVILSTHVLPEVEDVCQRVLIIAGGRIVASDAIDALAGGERFVRVRVGRPGPELEAALAAIEGVTECSPEGEGRYAIRTREDRRAEVARTAACWDLLELTGRERLEDIYLRLTSGKNA
ncbi:MAG: ABC transporter ATP-binding protein [Deltaproteobacteria bacterium]|nr:ABC transporter ATP-binding protein [Deltaproteobacteria bacterium]